MADIKGNTKETGKQQAKEKQEPVYTVDEFVSAAKKVFGNVRRECIVAAFKLAGRDTATVKEAQKIVNDFCKKEVK